MFLRCLRRRHAILALGLAVLPVVALVSEPAMPQSATPARAASPVADCGPKAIGLSRTVEIKTHGGPRFGHQQYHENDFLQDGEVVLTFDDGPSSVYTPQVLKALEAHCTKATFFMVGSRALAEAKLVKEVARRGHTIGTHTWSHANVRAIGAIRAKDEIELGFSGVQRAAGQHIAPFFRFPYLSDSRAMQAHLKSRDIAMFSIDADAYDYKTLNPAEVHKAIISQITAKRKGIILFHDIQTSTAHALQGLLADLKARGFRVVHMVPDTTATTLAAYDVQATRDASRRLAAVAANPLARRSVTWPMASIEASPTGVRPNYPPVAGAPIYQPQQPIAAPPPRRRYEDDNWAAKVFRF